MNNYFKKIFIIIFSALMISCGGSNYMLKESGKKEIMDADIAFSEYASKVGFFTAFMKYADDNIIKMGEGHFPIIGKKELEKGYNGKSGTKDLSWYPVNGNVAESGELGYTWGNWKFTTNDSTFYGNYFTVWNKQKDGKWKVSLDGGNSTPAPAN